MAQIGRYMVTSLAVAVFLITKDIAPFWCAFPVTTIWMILNGSFSRDEQR